MAKTSAVSSLNKLAISCLFGYKQIYLLSAYIKYLVQIGLKNDIIDVLVNYPELCKQLVSFFETKFNPDLNDKNRLEVLQNIEASIVASFDLVQDAYHDSIMKKFIISSKQHFEPIIIKKILMVILKIIYLLNLIQKP